MAAVRKWELWEKDDENGGSSSFFPESNLHARVMAMEDRELKTWEVEARSTNEAMRALHEHSGLGPYKPMLRDDGTPQPEDEDDEFLREVEGEYFDRWCAWCPHEQTAVLVPCELDAEEILRLGGFDWMCSACGNTHSMSFGHRRTERKPP
jgi:hypothetical protein